MSSNPDALGALVVIGQLAVRRRNHMVPHQTFRIDDEAHRRCVELLSVAGLTFHRKDRTTFRITERTPEVHCIIGELSSRQGTFPCQLTSSVSGFTFGVTVAEDLAILDEIERAFQGHLLDRI